MNYLESINKLKSSLRVHQADEETIMILENILRRSIGLEISFRDRKDIEIFLNRILAEWKADHSSFNLVPSDIPGVCHNYCVGIASKSFDEKRNGLNSGFKGLMLNLTAHWFACYSKNKTTLIFTNDWNAKKFKELYKDIIDNYTNFHNKKVYIIEIDPAGYFVRYPY